MFLYEHWLRLKITCIASGYPQMFPWVRVALRDRYNRREFPFKNYANFPNTQWVSDYSLFFLVFIGFFLLLLKPLYLFYFYYGFNSHDYFCYFSKPNVGVNLLVIRPHIYARKPPLFSWKPLNRDNRQWGKRPPVKIEPGVRFSFCLFLIFWFRFFLFLIFWFFTFVLGNICRF